MASLVYATFETNAFENWVESSSPPTTDVALSTAAPYAGTYHLRFTKIADSALAVGIEYIFAAAGYLGKEATVSCYMRRASGETGAFDLQIGFHFDPGTGYETGSVSTIAAVDAYQYFVVRYIVPSNAVNMKALLNVVGVFGQTVVCDIDNAFVEFEAPPAARSLAGARGRVKEWPFGLTSQGFGKGRHGIPPLQLPQRNRAY